MILTSLCLSQLVKCKLVQPSLGLTAFPRNRHGMESKQGSLVGQFVEELCARKVFTDLTGLHRHLDSATVYVPIFCVSTFGQSLVSVAVDNRCQSLVADTRVPVSRVWRQLARVYWQPPKDCTRSQLLISQLIVILCLLWYIRLFCRSRLVDSMKLKTFLIFWALQRSGPWVRRCRRATVLRPMRRQLEQKPSNLFWNRCDNLDNEVP